MQLENPFVGVNPHLNSLLQTPGTRSSPSAWPAFHAAYVVFIATVLNEHLPVNYAAYAEQSLQVYEMGAWQAGEMRRPDVTVFQQGRSTAGASPALAAAAPTWEGALELVMEQVRYPSAVVIRQVSDHAVFGRVVARIEVLSPSNKRGDFYALNRREALEAGIPLVEVDLLHETAGVLARLPQYPSHPDALPYLAAVFDPRPDLAEGKVRIYAFGLAEALPVIGVPLVGDEQVALDLHGAYQRAFVAHRFGLWLDYSQPPVRFDSYRADDQAWIRAQMEALRAG